jgi:hypothetical protein
MLPAHYMHLRGHSGAGVRSEDGKVSHLVSSIHVGAFLHQHLYNLVTAFTGSEVKGRITALQSQAQSDRA